ncbi:hypothetical protein RJT34_04615 [Clitoria ternatea]|uniref:BHLH domain-containing protein n=1 Tax=Clitoria ternatea TaxID=43366 RepID=A0AAN9KLY0_CLITE
MALNDEMENESEGKVNKKRSRKNEKEKKIGGEGKDGRSRESDHEMHIWTERERRKKMRNMFATLHSLLPDLPPKADKSSIVDEAVSYIKNLQQTVEKLEKQKQERLLATDSCMLINSQWPHPYEPFITDQGASDITPTTSDNKVTFRTWTSPNLVLNVCGDEAHFCIYAVKKPALLSTIAFLMHKHYLELTNCTISTIADGNAWMINAHVKRTSIADGIPLVESYKQAAGEIMPWIA